MQTRQKGQSRAQAVIKVVARSESFRHLGVLGLLCQLRLTAAQKISNNLTDTTAGTEMVNWNAETDRMPMKRFQNESDVLVQLQLTM